MPPVSCAHLLESTVRDFSLWIIASLSADTSLGCIVLLSGPTDYLSDGSTVVRLSNGHELLGRITGAGCVLGTTIATFCGAASMVASGTSEGVLVKGDMLLATAAGTLALTIAAQRAASREEVRGPGTFLPALIDELGVLTSEIVLRMAKIEVELE